jgi:hypothetical protein
MTRRTIAVFACVILSWISAPAFARPARTDWGPFSLRLSEGMTEQQAIKAIGYGPNRAELSTCGADTADGEWNCRIITFGDQYSNLTIYERSSDEGWIVTSWRVHPEF